MRPFLSSSRNFEGRFFPLFPKIVKNRWKKGLNDEVRLERFWKRLWDRSWPFNILESVKKFFMPLWNPFMPLLNTVCTPFRTRLCPFGNPFLPPFFPVQGVPFIALLSYLHMCHFESHHWATSDHHYSTDQWEVCICWRGTNLEQYAQYVCSHAQSKQTKWFC